MGKEFEKYLNKKYPLQNKNLKIHVLLTVVSREEAAANLTNGTFDILIAWYSHYARATEASRFF
jgi:hypothetical protein